MFISEFCHMSWVTGSLLANLGSKNFCIVLYETPCRTAELIDKSISMSQALNIKTMDVYINTSAHFPYQLP